MTDNETSVKDVGENISNAEWTKANSAFVIETRLDVLPEIRKFLLSLPNTRILFQKNSLGYLRIVEGKK